MASQAGHRRPAASRLLSAAILTAGVVRLEVERGTGIPHGPVMFHAFAARQEGRGWLLGMESLGRWVEIDAHGQRAIDLMKAGVAWQDVSAQLLDETGIDYDVGAFLMRLMPHGFIRSIGDHLVWDGESPPGALPAARAQWAQWLRDPRYTFPLLAVTLWGMVSLIQHPDHIASLRGLLHAGDPLLVVLGFALAGWGITVGHEAAHCAVARAYGVAARFQLGTRLHLLVCETDVTNAWGLPRWQRAYVLAAGIGFNLIVLAVAEIVLRFGPPAWLATVLGLILLVDLFQLALQAMLFLRMDGYYLVVALTSERNLQARARRAVRATWGQGAPCPTCLGRTRTTEGERECPLCTGGRAAGPARRRWLAAYAVVGAAGSAAVLGYGIAVIAWVLLPFMAHLTRMAAAGPASGDWRHATQAVAVLALLGTQLVAVTWISARKVRRRMARTAANARN